MSWGISLQVMLSVASISATVALAVRVDPDASHKLTVLLDVASQRHVAVSGCFLPAPAPAAPLLAAGGARPSPAGLPALILQGSAPCH